MRAPHHFRRCETTQSRESKPFVVTDKTRPEELPPELRGTIFDSSHVERGAHLQEQRDMVDKVFAEEPRKEDNVATATQPKADKKPANKVSAKPSTPFDRSKATAEWAQESPCEAASGSKKEPRACKGVGVVERTTTSGKKVMVCAAHVLATEVQTVAERIAANEAKEAAKAAKAATAPVKAEKAPAAAKQTAKATPAPKPSKRQPKA